MYCIYLACCACPCNTWSIFALQFCTTINLNVAGNGLVENVERLLQIKEEESEKLLPIV